MTKRKANVRRRFLLRVAGASFALLTLLGAGSQGIPVGFRPLIQLFGGGDLAATQQAMVELTETADAIFSGAELDSRAHGFVENTARQFETLDLRSLHRSLPERRPPWRRVRLSGRRQGSRYHLKATPLRSRGGVSPKGPFGERLGDMAVSFQSRPTRSVSGTEQYLVNADLGLGVGSATWSRVVMAYAGVMNTLARDGVKPYTETYAGMTKHIRSLFELERATVGPLKPGGPAHFVADGHFDTRRMGRRYPELAEYLDDLDELLRMKVDWLDEGGRRVARHVMNSKGLVGSLSTAVPGWMLTEGQASPTPRRRRFTSVMDLRFRVLGISLRIYDLRTTWTYTPTADGFAISGVTRREPEVEVEGRALGIVPTWAIDAFVPGDMESLTRQFLRVSCQGNGGRGIRFALRAQSASAKGPATLEIHHEIEAPDSLLIQFAVGIVHRKLVMDDDVQDDLVAMLKAGLKSLRSDLRGLYALRSGEAGPP